MHIKQQNFVHIKTARTLCTPKKTKLYGHQNTKNFIGGLSREVPITPSRRNIWPITPARRNFWTITPARRNFPPVTLSRLFFPNHAIKPSFSQSRYHAQLSSQSRLHARFFRNYAITPFFLNHAFTPIYFRNHTPKNGQSRLHAIPWGGGALMQSRKRRNIEE